MECVLADEATDMGGEYDETLWAVMLSLYGDDTDLSEFDRPLDYNAVVAEDQLAQTLTE